jgi:hypothetical protein
MQLFAIFAVILAPTLVFAYPSIERRGTQVSLSYDEVDGKLSQSIDTIACSDETNIFRTAGYGTFGALSGLPYIGGAPAIDGWNPPACGTCWRLKIEGKSVNIFVADVGGNEFNVSPAAIDELTGGQAVMRGRVNATA